MESWGIHFLTFLLGAAIGAAGNYLALKYKDRRRDSEESKKEKNTFKIITDQMPELIAEMKADFSRKENSLVREFFVLPHDKIPCNSEKPRFSYYENEHHNLKIKSKYWKIVGTLWMCQVQTHQFIGSQRSFRI
jgi:hypothetical protein